MNPAARALQARDFDAWLPLWDGYNSFYRNEVPAEVTENTFRRLHEGADGFFGLVAEHDGGLAGLAHAIFHPSTWTTRSYCYLEDLFIARPHRGSGVARPDRRHLRGSGPQGCGQRLLAHPILQRPGPVPLRPGGQAHVLRGLREVAIHARTRRDAGTGDGG